MVVGVLTMELFIGGVNSLKDKRRVLKSMLDKLKGRFNVSVAEVGKQDAWQFSTVGISCVSNASAHAHQTLAAVVRYVETLGTVEILDVRTELL